MCQDCDDRQKKLSYAAADVNTERVRLLVDALRSGEFEQAQGQLTRLDTYFTLDADGTPSVETLTETHCCLGVACIIAMRHGLELDVTDASGGRAYGGALQYLPDPVMQWYGFTDCDPTIIDADFALQDAADYNDAGHDFGEVADAFQRTYLDPPPALSGEECEDD